MDNQLKVRTAQSREDARNIAVLAETVWTEHYTPIIGAEQVTYMLDRFQSADVIYDDFTSKGYIYYMAFDSEDLIGYLAIKPDDKEKEIFLSKIYIEKSFRGRGISRELVKIAKEMAEGKRYKRIWLTVNKNNENSINAYKNLGFKISGEIVSDIGNGFVMDDYEMVMTI